MKKAFSLLELIFAIVIIGIIASFAIPKYINTKNYALASTIKRDLVSIINSLQTHYLINRKIDNISDVITLNSSNWQLLEKNIIFSNSGQACINLKVEDTKIIINVYKDSSSVCKLLDEMKVKTQNIDLI